MTADLRREEIALTPLEVEAINANAGYPGTLTPTQADDAIRGILEHGLRHIPGTTPAEERQFNDGYAFGLYRALDLIGRVRSQDTATARIALLERALRQSADAAHDFAQLDPDMGPEHSVHPWTRCPQDICVKARAVLSGETDG